ncbi:MAG: polyribonucleotide nucleotidyltransferase, partial [Phycisphaerae bacterium]
MSVVRVQKEIAGRTLTLETGKVAKQAHGAVWVQYGETVVLATVLTEKPHRDVGFFPLFVDFREASYSAGKIPGGFFKREGRPTTKEVITMRLIDRPIRPCFPKDFLNEVQIQCLTLSYDGENEPDILALIGASAALSLSPAPFDGPIGAARVGYIDGELVVNPTLEDIDEGDMDLIVAGPREAVNMLEFAGKEISEDVAAKAIEMGFQTCCETMDLIDELVEKSGGKPEVDYEPTPVPDELKAELTEKYGDRIRQAKQIAGKVERNDALSAIKEEAMAAYFPEDAPGDEEPPFTPWQVGEALYCIEGTIQRELILGGTRPDGRARNEVRPLAIEVGVLPRTHGSAIFDRGETQALVMATLGCPRDQAIIDGIREEYKKSFYLHYNFPPFSVGQIKPIRGPSRRDIGHGFLAEKAISAVMPDAEEFPYTVRVVSELLGSNGSTSQATICGASLALMDAGIPIKRPVAGISIGMVHDEENPDRYVLLTDIMGEEDFHGDMDFKVAGSSAGITAIQLDMKARGIPQDRIVETLAQAKEAREHILQAMNAVIPAPREELNEFAPRMLTMMIDPKKIGKVIGPGGKMINAIQDETGASIDIEDDGRIFIASSDMDGAQAALKWVEGIVAEAEVGKVYEGTVVSVRDFGAFIEVLPGTEGLCHVSELSTGYVNNAEDICKVGDTLKVKCIDIDDMGRVKVSRKAVLVDEGVETDPLMPEGSADGGGERRGGGGGGGGRDRGG